MTHRAKRPEDRVHERAVAELRSAFLSRGYNKKTRPFPFFHCPNEGDRTRAHQAKLDRMGFSAGVPDLLIMYPTLQGNPGAALEFKARPGMKPSPKQRVWLEHLDAIGFATAVPGGHEEAALILVKWGYIHADVVPVWLASMLR